MEFQEQWLSLTHKPSPFNYDGGGVGRILKSVYMNDDEYT